MKSQYTLEQWAEVLVEANCVPEDRATYYLSQRRAGKTHDEAFAAAAYKAASCPLRPFEDDDVICFVRLDRYSNKISDDFGQQVHYWQMRTKGQSHRMAELLATRKFPGIRGTDSTFMSGSHMQDTIMDGVRQRMAAAEGVDTNGKRYISGLARFPGDPEAWVSGLSDVSRICTDRGWNCHGAFEYEAPEPWSPPAPDVPVAPDIVASRVSAELEPYDSGEITSRLIADTVEKTKALLAGTEDAGQDLKVSNYEYEDALAVSESD